MSYRVIGSGVIDFKEDIAVEMKNLFKEKLSNIEDLTVYAETDGELSIRFCDHYNYDEIEKFLPEIADKVYEGCIECEGEDAFWKLEFDCGKWKSYDGIKSYEKYGRELYGR